MNPMKRKKMDFNLISIECNQTLHDATPVSTCSKTHPAYSTLFLSRGGMPASGVGKVEVKLRPR